ncbi:MAG: hypothetical protein A3J48_03750 [Candidatus Doudnabacteria bacterium RIFCSPHIGHO2_02_FULL_46_11]|uniref:Nudix hydrolase domain-containing protein n=1 Tax=Candidatus Doudnabacteria bacterium RIFCSPHIGHO2_02_FULL_46_11 TaxID=1817832 RepID=A0A1F5P432_9BACT|nr:MAG: hypothetical protein A3J48_03750 [Candidatus Doudnabacteria bacterium RIFCSPHIGHO2_02_FULL_46_11]
MSDDNKPRIGVGVMVLKNTNKVLLHKRKSSHGSGEYANPGGHLEYMESFEEYARRECREEAGIEIKNIRFHYLLNMKEYTPKHYVHIQFIADWASGEPEILEPEKAEFWGWYDIDNLPEPIFKSTKYSLEAFRTGRNFFDA